MCGGRATHVRRRDDIITIITPQPIWRVGTPTRLLRCRCRRTRSMPHNKIRVEPQRGVEHHLPHPKIHRSAKRDRQQLVMVEEKEKRQRNAPFPSRSPKQ